MAARRSAARRRRQSAFGAGTRVPRGLRWSCAVIFLVGAVLMAIGAWGLLRGTGRVAVALGSGGSVVVGALLIVFAALLPWLGDGPVRIGPLVVTLRIRSVGSRRSRRSRRSQPLRSRRRPGPRQ